MSGNINPLSVTGYIQRVHIFFGRRAVYCLVGVVLKENRRVDRSGWIYDSIVDMLMSLMKFLLAPDWLSLEQAVKRCQVKHIQSSMCGAGCLRHFIRYPGLDSVSLHVHTDVLLCSSGALG